MADQDAAVRSAAFDFLAQQTERFGDVLPRSLLERGFPVGNDIVRLMGPQGIFKPAALELPLSITTVPIVEGRARPYEDAVDETGLIAYRYRGTDPGHRDNLGLREVMKQQLPLIYFYGVVPGQYLPVWPVYVVADDPGDLTFTVAVDEAHALFRSDESVPIVEARRQYVTRLTRHRLHQAGFRERVIRAYRKMCAVCRLRHDELLDAAHILPDSHPLGEPIVPNGLALCKLHHAAFDRHIIGVRPDLVIEVSLTVLEEVDGPMLIHGLQGFHGEPISVPRASENRPREQFLEARYELFRAAG